MSKRTNNPAPHAAEKEAPATPAAPTEREPGTRADGEALPPTAIDPGANDHTGQDIPPLPEPDVEGVGEERGPSADKTGRDREKIGPDAAKMVKDATGF